MQQEPGTPPESPNSTGITDFLARLPAADRTTLLARAERRSVVKGAFIFVAGSPGDYVYCLEHGRIKVFYLSPGGKEVLLWFCFPGEIFGLAEACHGGGREVHAEACEPSSLLRVRRQDFAGFLAAHPAAALLVNDVLASRLRSLGSVIQGLVSNDVNGRVWQLLLRLAASHGRKGDNGDIHLDIRLTHQEIASMVGTTRQSVTVALNALRRQGMLDVDSRRRIRIRGDRPPPPLAASDPAAVAIR